ncbi:TPA: hypothetical protein ACMDQP_003112 [Vibrio cholerae]
MHIHYHGTHINLLYSYLNHLGYSDADITSKGVYRPLLQLISPESMQKLEDYVISQSEQLFPILRDHGFNSLVFILQEFDKAVGCTYHLPEDAEECQELLNSSFDKAMQKLEVAKNNGVEITFHYANKGEV